MKKTLIILGSIFFFSCTSDNTTHDVNTGGEGAIDESVEIGSGEEINPQLQMQDDTAAFEVDTVTTPGRANQ